MVMIGSLSSRAVSGTAPFVATLVATFIFIIVHWLISFFSERSPALSRLQQLRTLHNEICRIV